VCKYTTGRILLGYAAHSGAHAMHMDVSTAYLNAPLEEEVYVTMKGKTYRVIKALYGLKQSARAWNKEVTRVLKEGGFVQSPYDPSLYHRRDDNMGVAYVLVYVDDLLIVSKSMEAMHRTREFLNNKFLMKDLGPVTKYLGMEVTRNTKEGGLEVGQGKYASKCGTRYAEVLSSMPPGRVMTPMDPELQKRLVHPESEEEREAADGGLYQSILGSLMYASSTTRPDLAYAVNSLAQFSRDPLAVHLQAAIRALRYFVDTGDMVLRYARGSGVRLVGATDSDHGKEVGAKSRGAYLFKAFGGPSRGKVRRCRGCPRAHVRRSTRPSRKGPKRPFGSRDSWRRWGFGMGVP
jgi:hypothetical protein